MSFFYFIFGNIRLFFIKAIDKILTGCYNKAMKSKKAGQVNNMSFESNVRYRFTVMDEKDKLLPVYLIGIGEDNNQNVYRESGYHYDQILLIDSGEGIFEYGEKKYIITKKTCIFIPKNIPHSYTAKTLPFKLYWICFGGAYLPELLSYFQLSDICIYSAPSYSKLKSLHNKLYQIAESTYDPVMYSNYTYEILSNFCRQRNTSFTDAKTSGKLARIKEYIEENHTKDISLDFLADKFEISKYTICRCFTRIYGISLGEYQLKLKLTTAKHMLMYSDETAKNISKQCGFNDHVYFGKIFKKYENLTPKEFRKTFRQ